MNTTTEIVEPVTSRARIAPTSASGIVNRMTNGCSSDSNCEAITRYTRNTARPNANSSDCSDCVSSSPWPPICRPMPAPRPPSAFATISSTSRTAVPRSMSRRLAETIATRT